MFQKLTFQKLYHPCPYFPLIMQVKTFKPQLVAVRNESLVDELKEALADVEEKPEIIPGEQGVIEVSHHFTFSSTSWILSIRIQTVLTCDEFSR